MQGGPHFTEAYLHVPNDRIPPAAQVFKYVRMCVYIYIRVEHLPKHKNPLNVSNYNIICIMLTAGV